jgi:hypothetical protein
MVTDTENVWNIGGDFIKNNEDNFMKTFECIAHNGANGKQIVLFVRAFTASTARMDALLQARAQFGSSAGAVTIISCKEV